MTGLDKARKTAKKLKKEVEATKALTKVKIQGISVSSNVAERFRQTADVGMKNISGQSLLQLKVVEVKSRNRLENGDKPEVGSFFYAPTKESYKNPIVSIVTVSRGFYTLRVDQNGNPTTNSRGDKTKYNQLVGGVILDSMKPFVLFASGIRWKPMNDFVKSIRPYTKSKKSPIPMYAFQVKLGTVLTESENYAVDYGLVKNDKDQFLLVDDESLIDFLLVSSDKLEESIEGFIDAREVDRYTGELVKNQLINDVTETLTESPVEEALVASEESTPNTEEKDDIPF